LDGEWLWVHFTIGPSDGSTWFEHSRTPSGTGWVDGWKWAESLSKTPSALVGYFDAKGLLADAMREVPKAIDCLTTFSSIERVGFNVDTDGKKLGAKLTIQLGAAAGGVAQTLVAPPLGWAAARTNAPLAADLNLDLRAAASWAQSCIGRDSGSLVSMLDQYGIRTARAFVHTLDPDQKEGTGAVALDLSNARFLRAQLDQIPRRSMFESSKTFGAYKGKHISVPFVGSGDYVLDEHIAIASMGDGLLARIGSGAAPAGPPPVVAIDLRPPGLPVDVWTFLLGQVDAPNPQRFAQRLITWNDLHVGAQLEQSAPGNEAAGNRP